MFDNLSQGWIVILLRPNRAEQEFVFPRSGPVVQVFLFFVRYASAMCLSSLCMIGLLFLCMLWLQIILSGWLLIYDACRARRYSGATLRWGCLNYFSGVIFTNNHLNLKKFKYLTYARRFLALAYSTESLDWFSDGIWWLLLTESDDNDATESCILALLPIRYDLFSLKNLGKNSLSPGLTVKKSEYHNF